LEKTEEDHFLVGGIEDYMELVAIGIVAPAVDLWIMGLVISEAAT